MKSFFASILLVIVLLFSGCHDIIVLECENKEPVTIVKNINKVFPVYATSYEASLALSLKTLKGLEVDASPELKEKIVKLRQDLDQERSALQMFLKAAVIALQQAPCSEVNRARFWDTLDILINKATSVKEVVSKIEKVSKSVNMTSKTNEIDQIISTYKFFTIPAE